jgi:hypothetical protein
MYRLLVVTALFGSLVFVGSGCVSSEETTSEEATARAGQPTDTVEPTEAPKTTGTPEPEETVTRSLPQSTIDISECTLGARYEADVTVPDNTRIEGGTDFTKTWRIKNVGTCPWTAGYHLAFVGGHQMDGPESVSVPETSPGESAEISVELSSPREQGVHKGQWQMCATGQRCFGDEVFVQIVSTGLPTSTPFPTATPQVLTTAKGDLEVPGSGFLDGRDPEASPPGTVISINIWDGVPRQKVVCALSHGVSLDILDVGYYADESRYYFRVRSGSCEGWVSEPFVSPEYHPPVGDALP